MAGAMCRLGPMGLLLHQVLVPPCSVAAQAAPGLALHMCPVTGVQKIPRRKAAKRGRSLAMMRMFLMRRHSLLLHPQLVGLVLAMLVRSMPAVGPRACCARLWSQLQALQVWLLL